jgi:hypothetical protein
MGCSTSASGGEVVTYKDPDATEQMFKKNKLKGADGDHLE